MRAEQPVSGANRTAAMQSILQYKFSPGFDNLEEELRTSKGLVKTYHAVFGEAISDSITQAVIKSKMPADRRARQSHVKPVQDEDSGHQLKLCSTPSGTDGDWLGQEQRSGKGQEQGERERKKERQEQRKWAKKSRRAKSSRCGVTTAENGVTNLPTVGMENKNRCTRYKVKLARPVQAVRSPH